ncbi:MAG TPA: cupin domain-containing protein [Azospirillum sp.]
MLRATMILSAAIPLAVLAAGSVPAALAGSAGEHAIHTNETLQWTPVGALPPGAQWSVMAGNPAEPGPFALRLKFPDGYRVPAHWHSQPETVTVISGSFGLGMGHSGDRDKTQVLPAGGFAFMPAMQPHYAIANGETVVQVNGTGPFDLNYVDPSQDPRKQVGASQ